MYGFNFEPVLRLAQPKFIVRTSNPILTAFRCGSIIKKIGMNRTWPKSNQTEPKSDKTEHT